MNSESGSGDDRAPTGSKANDLGSDPRVEPSRAGRREQKRLRILAARVVQKLGGDNARQTLKRAQRPDRSSVAGRIADPSQIYDPVTAGEDLPDGFDQVRRRDDIVPVYDPVFTSPATVGWEPSHLVIGVEINGDARAYPVRYLDKREMIVDNVGDTPILVSWCPKCGTAMVHDRRLDGTTLVLGNQGAIWQNAMTWWDHDTGSIWSQPFGEAIAGPRRGAQLELLDSTLTTWESWRSSHPDTEALRARSQAHRYTTDDLAIVATIGGESSAFSFSLLDTGEVINDIVGTTAVAAFADPSGTASWAVFERTIGSTVLTLDRTEHGLVDTETGSRWDAVTGAAIDGPHIGESLAIIPTSTMKPEEYAVLWPEGRIWE